MRSLLSSSVWSVALVGFASAATASGQVVVSLTPDGESRFIDHFSAAFAQVNLDPEGLYSLADDSLFGAVDAFPQDDDWADLGTLTLDAAVTPTSSGTFDVVGTTGFDIDSVVDGGVVSIFAAFGGGAYTTTLSNLTGSVTLDNGSVTALSASADIAFAFPGVAPGTPPYSGTFQITDTGFTLAVDETIAPSPQSPPIRQEWAFTGDASFEVVPEPGVAALGLLGVGSLLVRRRRN
ncbi:MAG: hypothetical protein AAGE65_11945 [Planctomycetota bacterium]